MKSSNIFVNMLFGHGLLRLESIDSPEKFKKLTMGFLKEERTDIVGVRFLF